MGFASSLPRTGARNKDILVEVDHLSGSPIVRATEREMAGAAIKFVQVVFLDRFGAPRNVVTDNGPAFVAVAVRQCVPSGGVSWSTVRQYSSQANERVGLVVATMKRALEKVAQS